MRPLEAWADRRQEGRQHGRCDDDADKRDEDARVAEAAQERYRQHDQGEKAGPHGDPAEGDGPPRRGDGRRDGIVVGQATPALLTPASDDERASSRWRSRGRSGRSGTSPGRSPGQRSSRLL